METTNVKRYRYFLYSSSQYDMRVDIDKNVHKVFVSGKVFIKGKWAPFTEISSSPNNTFADSKIVAEGYLEDMKYQNPTSVWEVLK